MAKKREKDNKSKQTLKNNKGHKKNNFFLTTSTLYRKRTPSFFHDSKIKIAKKKHLRSQQVM